MNSKSTITILHPCYNPRYGWEKDLVYYYNLLKDRLSNQFYVALVVVDDGSVKRVNTEAIDFIKSGIPEFIYLKNAKNRGKGFALRSAVDKIDSDYIIYTDYDYPYLIDNIIEMINLLHEKKNNVVVGVRDSNYFKRLPLKRRFISSALCLINNIFLPNLFTKDTQSGLKGFDKYGKSIFMKTKIDRFLFDTEFIHLVSKNNDVKIAKVQLHLRDGINFSEINSKILKQELLNYLKIFSRRSK
ncbi:MAG TPA: glycosyl transferase [Lentisphaeria bacterium]|nr:MAG: hypothetical protein A2X47_06425 [Lentisphaerae bacterium GWF2_38_69]HBM15534.1 glycosyl transferase [Lentisphaeria bacterium]